VKAGEHPLVQRDDIGIGRETVAAQETPVRGFVLILGRPRRWRHGACVVSAAVPISTVEPNEGRRVDRLWVKERAGGTTR